MVFIMIMERVMMLIKITSIVMNVSKDGDESIDDIDYNDDNYIWHTTDGVLEAK